MRDAAISTILLAGIATAGDLVWARWLPEHLTVAGVAHGALLFLAAGALLGWPHRRALAGASWGMLAGAAGAGAFYAIAPVLGMSAMFVAWFALWLVLGSASVLVLRGVRQPIEAVGRSLAAGLLSGVAFYAVSDMWRNWNPATIDYVAHLWRWAVAFAPAFVCLQVMSAPLTARGRRY